MVVETQSKFIISDGLYTKLKFVALVLLPALSTFYFTLGAAWDFPSVEQVLGSLAAVDTFLGIMLGVSTTLYNSSEAKYDGQIVLNTTETGGKLYSLELNGDPQELDQKKDVTFKVSPPVVPPTKL